jgi:hypothetical protein
VDTGSRQENASKQNRAFSSEVDTGSRRENASKIKSSVFQRSGYRFASLSASGAPGAWSAELFARQANQRRFCHVLLSSPRSKNILLPKQLKSIL